MHLKMDIENPNLHTDRHPINYPAWLRRYPRLLNTIDFFIAVVALIIAIPLFLAPIALGLLLVLLFFTFLLQLAPDFELANVEVSLHNVSNDSQQQIMVMSEWSLALSVSSGSFMSHDIAYKCINVTIHDHLTGSSMETTIPPFHQNWYNNDETDVHAFVRGPLPRFNATNIELSFDVEIQSLVKYKNWINSHPKGFTKVTCKDMKVNKLSSTMYGNLRGGPYRCVEEYLV